MGTCFSEETDVYTVMDKYDYDPDALDLCECCGGIFAIFYECCR
jgi:hypothetical protein